MSTSSARPSDAGGCDPSEPDYQRQRVVDVALLDGAEPSDRLTESLRR